MFGFGFYREGNIIEDDFFFFLGNGNKFFNSLEERIGRGGSGYVN